MSKKNNNKIRTSNEFSDRPKRKLPDIAPAIEENSVEEPQVEESVEEPVDELVETPVVKEERTGSQEPPHIDYVEIKEPLGSKKENGVILAVVLSSALILTLLGFLIYYECSWRLQEQQEQEEVTVVDSEYDSLRLIVRNFVATIDESNKAELCQKLVEIYLNAANSTDDIDTIIQTIQEKTQEILGFNDRIPKTKEYEWYKLFGVHGVIDNWVTESGVGFTKQNQKEIFTAIAEGLK